MIFFTQFITGLNSARAGQLRSLYGHLPPAWAVTQPIDSLPSTNQLHLAISLPFRNEADLNTLLGQLYDPASPKFHQFLNPAQFAAAFGPTETDYQNVVNFAKTNGLTILRMFANRGMLELNGRVSDVERAFHVHLRRFQHPTEARSFYAPDVEPSLDSGIPVLFVGGLSSYQMPHPASLHATPLTRGQNANPNSGSESGLYAGQDIRSAYVPGVTNTGAGQSLALVEFDSYYSNDISNYLALPGLGVATSVILSNIVVGSAFATGSGNTEVALDIDMAISMAPGLSTIYVYEATNDAASPDLLMNALASDTNRLAQQISCSWSGFSDSAIEADFQELRVQGQSFFIASGDSGAYFYGSGRHSTSNPVEPPCDDTNVTSVGGTTLYTSGPQGSWTNETTWNWFSQPQDGLNANATSGGISPNYLLPSWQQGISTTANKASSTHRNIPDVAMVANQLLIYGDDGTQYFVGGTSAAAPLWAGLTALINQQLASEAQPVEGFLNPALYTLAKSTNYQACFHDITVGNNTNLHSAGLYNSAPGYDLCTGWGSPNGSNLINALCPEPLSVSPSTGFTSTGPVGGPFSPSSENVILTNLATSPFNWALGVALPWLSTSAGGGVLSNNVAGVKVALGLNSAANSLPAGSYTNTVYFTNLNDLIVQTQQYSLTITGTPPTVTWTNPPAITYGTALGDAELDATASVPGTFAYSPSSGTILDVGLQTLSVVFSPTNAAPYNAITAMVNLAVSPAALSVVAASTNRLYGQPNPSFQGVISGLQNGDNILPLNSCSAGPGSPAGNYQIVAGLSDPANRQTNYTVSLVSGTLTVNPAPLEVAAVNYQRPYGSTNPDFMANYSGFVNLDTSGVLSGSPSFTTAATTNSPTGVYPILIGAGSLSATNYSFVFSNGNLSVVAAPVTVSAVVANKTYDGRTNATIAGLTLNGLVSGDDVTLSAGSAAFADKNAGVAKSVFIAGLSLSGTQATNYVLGANLLITNATIYPLPLTVAAVPDTRVYDGSTNSAGTPVFSPALAGGDTAGFSQTFDTPLVGGGKTLTPAGLVNDANGGSNYLYTYEAVNEGEIDPAALTITADNTNKLYGQTLTFAGTEFDAVGLVSGDTVAGVSLGSAGATNSAPAGTYSINVSNAIGSGLANYTINYVTGSLTVSAFTNVITSIVLNPDGSRTIIYTGVPGQSCRLQMTTDLSGLLWTDVATNQIDNTGLTSVNDTNNPGQPMVFYRTIFP